MAVRKKSLQNRAKRPAKIKVKLSRGEKLKESAMVGVEKKNAAWLNTIRKQAIRIAKRKGSVTTDDLRKYAMKKELKPSHPNAWGAVFRGSDWRVIGRCKSRLPSNHAREIRVWAYNQEK